MNHLVLSVLRVLSKKHWIAAHVGGGDFDSIGREFLGHFQRFGMLHTDDVLDVGCGAGRMAVPLSTYLTSGSYVGIDVSADALAMCRERISRPDFVFLRADVRNGMYNPSGSSAAVYRFPFPDRHFDFVFLCSVFTHMLRDEIENYLREIVRVMRDGATCFITWYIANEKPLKFSAYDDISFVRRRLTPTAAITYRSEYVSDLYRRHGLTAEIYHGSWNNPSGLTHQDVVVSRKTHPR